MSAQDVGARGVESVARALDLLDDLAEGECGLVELARRTNLKPSTTHRLLATLVKSGHVRRSESGKYALGVRVLRLGAVVRPAADAFTATAKPFVDRVHRVARKTTNLFVLENANPVLLDQRLDPSAQEIFMDVGTRLPIHATASGKATLAYSDPTVVERVLGASRLDPYTERTITRPELLMMELYKIRERGFAVGHHEYAVLTTGIAAPIFDQRDRVIGALSVSLIDTGQALMPRDEVEALGELVGCAAIEASAALGYDGPSPWHAAGAQAARN